MTEKEILEIAAQQAGIIGVYNDQMNAIEIDTTHLRSPTKEYVYWRPIKDGTTSKEVQDEH